MNEKEQTCKSWKPHFRPYEIERGNYSQYAVEKEDDSGRKRMYINGVSSGVKIDGHQERMTTKAIESFMNQANSGTILLYPDVHGIKASEDIGILNKAEIMPNHDWFTEYRLYDEHDDVGQNTVDKAKKLFKQLKGIAPYPKPIQKGFSIEGNIPDGGIIDAQKDEFGNLTNRVIDDVELEGVVLVPKPAYNDSVANACYKSLGEINPWKAESVRKNVIETLNQNLQEKEAKNKYFEKRYDIQDALEETIKKIMLRNDADKQDQLDIVFDEFKTLMINLLLESQDLFQREEDNVEVGPYGDLNVNKNSQREKIIKQLGDYLPELQKIVTRIKTEDNNVKKS